MLPATISVVEENAFAANTQLKCIDFAKCEKESVFTQRNDLGINEYAIIYAPENATATNLTNVVYGSNGDLTCAHLVLSDNADFVVPREFKANEISYDRLFEKDSKSTLCLPFDMELPDGAKAYMLTEVVDDILIFSQQENLQGNIPYVIVTEKDMTLGTSTETLVPATRKEQLQVSAGNYMMMGTLASISEEKAVKEGIYTLGKDACWNKKTEATEGEAVSPYHAYIKATEVDMPNTLQMRLVDKKPEDTPVAIEDIKTDEVQMTDTIYDINGCRVVEVQKGNVYILNGNKVIFK